MKRKTLVAALLPVMFFGLLSSAAEPAIADVYVPPGPWYNMSEWISPTLFVIDMENMMPIGWVYSDGPMYDPAAMFGQKYFDQIEQRFPMVIGDTTISFSTDVMIFGWIPGVSVSPDQVPPPVVLVITWNGVPYTVTLDLNEHPYEEKPRIVGWEYPSTIYPDIEDVYPFSYPYDPEAPFKTVSWNVWVGDGNIITEIPEELYDFPQGYYFWYIFHPNVGDWIGYNCVGETKHPPTYDITALFEYSTSQIWFWHVCFDVRFLEIHKEIKPDWVLEPEWTRLYPIEDSWVLDVAPDNNFGGDTILHARSDEEQTRRSYLKFDLSGIDPDRIIHASLWMYCTAATGADLMYVDIHPTTDNWNEYTITWNNAPPPTAGWLTDTLVDGSGQWYEWGNGVTDYVRTEAMGDDLLSLLVKLWPEDTSNPAIWHRDFSSREGANPPYLDILLRAPYDGLPIPISDMIIIKNVGKVPATELDILEQFPIDPKKGVSHDWDGASISITGGTVRANFSIQMPDDWGDYWPYIMPDGPYYDLSTLYPGETMTIITPATVTIPTDGDWYWSGTFVFDLMVSAHEIPPWKYPRSMDGLLIGMPDWEQGEYLWTGWKLLESWDSPTGWLFTIIDEWFVPGPINRNPLPPQSDYKFEMPLDPIPVDLTGDGKIDGADVEQVRLAIVGLVPYTVEMDIDANGKVDAFDLASYQLAAS